MKDLMMSVMMRNNVLLLFFLISHRQLLRNLINNSQIGVELVVVINNRITNLFFLFIDLL
jgi:hypothetical protein